MDVTVKGPNQQRTTSEGVTEVVVDIGGEFQVVVEVDNELLETRLLLNRPNQDIECLWSVIDQELES